MKKRIVTRTQLEAAVKCALLEVGAFQAHLASDKFKGTDTDSARKDWIATADVLERLRIIKSFLEVTP